MAVVDAIIQGALNGFGSAIGSYLALTYGVSHLKKISLLKTSTDNDLGKKEEELKSMHPK